MKKISCLFALTFIFHLSAAYALNTLFQVSTGNALIAGLYQGAVDFNALAEQGNFGLGSVKGMDGELVAIEGKFYRIAPDGKVNIIPLTETTPYAMVTHFKAGSHFTINEVVSYKDLINKLNEHIKNRNIPYAIHLKSHFESLELRAVRGAKPPYPPFTQLVKKQAIFNLHEVNGDGVGFFTPVYFSKVNVPGYHIHFITTDRKTGGHILECKAKQLEVELMPMQALTIRFPETKAFESSTKLNKNNMPLMLSSFGDGVQKK